MKNLLLYCHPSQFTVIYAIHRKYLEWLTYASTCCPLAMKNIRRTLISRIICCDMTDTVIAPVAFSSPNSILRCPTSTLPWLWIVLQICSLDPHSMRMPCNVNSIPLNLNTKPIVHWIFIASGRSVDICTRRITRCMVLDRVIN